MKEYFIVNAMSGAVQIFISRNRYDAMRKGRAWFGTSKLHIYAR